MTEAEIMKALEICSQNDTNKHYMMTYHGMPLHILFEATLALINRKNAESEDVRTQLDRLTIYFDEAVEAKLKTVRAEAIKEFTERVKEKSFDNAGFTPDEDWRMVYLDELEEIAKEMGVE